MSTLTKGPVGEQDLKRWDGTGSRTFSRETSTGGRVVLNKIGYEVDALISYGNGVNYTAATINKAIGAIGSVVTRLVLRPGTWDVNATVDFPSNITVVIPAGCVLDVDTGVTITFSGPIEADSPDWQSGAGTFTVLASSNMKIMNTHLQLKGASCIFRFKDTSGVEWGIRSYGNNFEICENEGTEASPTWTARSTVSTTTGGGALTINMRGDRNTTKCWFYLNTAPTGWTIDNTPADALLCVKGGSNAYNTTGGTQAGTWTQNHIHTTGDVTLSSSQSGVPVHTHPVLAYQYGGGTPLYVALTGTQVGGETPVSGNNAAVDAATAHNHGNTSTATSSTWRPLGQIGIIATLT
jgi:hypothetical protein